MATPSAPQRFSKDEVLDRIERGEKAGIYTELIDVDEVEGLNDAYLAIEESTLPPMQPSTPLTSDEFKHYVRLVHNAIRSIDAAHDAYAKNKDGKVIGRTYAKRYLDSINMFEVQLVSGKLVKAVHRAQDGIITMPSWTKIPGIGYSRYDTFAGRMAHVIEALRVWKLLGCGLFMDHDTTTEKRLALQPEKEMLTARLFKEDTEKSDISALLRLQYARSILPDPDPTPNPTPDPESGEPGAAAKNDEGGKHTDKSTNKHADKDEDADTSGTPAPASKKRKHGNSDAALDNPGERPYNTRSAKKQSAGRTSATLAEASTSAKAGPSTAVSSDVASGSVQPATPAAPTARNTTRSARSTPASCGPSTRGSRLRSVQSANASAGSPSEGITSGLRSAKRRATQQEASSDPHTSADRCDAKFMPSNPSHHQDQPPPDYQASQRATYGFSQSGRLANGLPSATEYSWALEAQWAAAKALGPYQAPQNRDVTATNNSPTHATTTTTSLLNGTVTSSSHGPLADMRQTQTGSSVIHGGVGGVGGVVFNNYFQPLAPSPPSGQAFASPHNGNGQSVDYYFGPDKSQSQKGNQDVLERDSPLPPRAPPNTPQEAPTTDRNVQEQYQVNESLLPFGRLPGNYSRQSNYALPARSAPPAAANPGLPIVHPIVRAPPRSGWSLDLAGETHTDAMAIQDCRRVGYGLSPMHTTGWLQQEGQPVAAGNTPVAGPSASAPRAGSSLDMEEYTLEEQKALADRHRISMGLYPVYTTGWRFQEEEPGTPYAWTGPPEGADDGFVPFREASEEYDYDFKEESRNQAKNNAGDKRKRDEGPEDGLQAVRSAANARIPATRFRITDDMFRRSHNQAKNNAGDKHKRDEGPEDGSQASRPAAAPRTQTKPYTAKITRVVSTRPHYQVRDEAVAPDYRMDGLQAVRSAANARIPATRFRITDDMLRRSRKQANDDAGSKGELEEDREGGSSAARPAAAPRARTPTKRYRINPRLGR